MPMPRIIVTVSGGPKDSIWNKLAEYLGREPTPQEARDEVRRILTECSRARRGVYGPPHNHAGTLAARR